MEQLKPIETEKSDSSLLDEILRHNASLQSVVDKQVLICRDLFGYSEPDIKKDCAITKNEKIPSVADTMQSLNADRDALISRIFNATNELEAFVKTRLTFSHEQNGAIGFNRMNPEFGTY